MQVSVNMSIFHDHKVEEKALLYLIIIGSEQKLVPINLRKVGYILMFMKFTIGYVSDHIIMYAVNHTDLSTVRPMHFSKKSS